MVAKILSTIKKVEIIDKMGFAAALLNADNQIFVVNVAALVEPTIRPIILFCQAQVALLTSEETGIPAKYSDFSNVFSLDSAVKLPEYIGIDDHLIDLLDNNQPPYGLIYRLGLVELEILKPYIKANLASSFIGPSNSPANIPILFV